MSRTLVVSKTSNLLVQKIISHQGLSIAIWLVLVGTAFLASRLYNLTILPIFVDESTHISWALEMIESGDWLPTDGTRLLPVWILRLFLPVAADILWSGRLVSVFMGLLAAFGCYLVGQNLFNHRAGAIAFTLYAVNPLTLSNDRLMLTDSYEAAWTVLTVWLSLKMVKTQSNWWHSLILGFILGLATLTNLRGTLAWGLPLLVIGLLGQGRWSKFPKYLLLTYLIALLLSAPIWWLLPAGLQESLGVSLVGNSSSTWLRYWGQNTGLVASWLWIYITPGLTVVLVAATIFTAWQRPRLALLLVGWALIFIVPWLFVAEIWYPRYILPAFPALFILLGNILDTFWRQLPQKKLCSDDFSRPPAGGLNFWRWAAQLPPKKAWLASSLGLVGITFLLWPMIYFDYWQLNNPILAPFPAADRFQYIEGWPSGYGISEVVEHLHTQANHKGDIFVAMDYRVFMLMGELAFDVWREQEDSIHLLNAKRQRGSSAEEIYRQVSTSPLPVYWVTAGNGHEDDKLKNEVLSLLHIEHIASVARPGNKSQMHIYFISPQSNSR